MSLPQILARTSCNWRLVKQVHSSMWSICRMTSLFVERTDSVVRGWRETGFRLSTPVDGHIEGGTCSVSSILRAETMQDLLCFEQGPIPCKASWRLARADFKLKCCGNWSDEWFPTVMENLSVCWGGRVVLGWKAESDRLPARYAGRSGDNGEPPRPEKSLSQLRFPASKVVGSALPSFSKSETSMDAVVRFWSWDKVAQLFLHDHWSASNVLGLLVFNRLKGELVFKHLCWMQAW